MPESEHDRHVNVSKFKADLTDDPVDANIESLPIEEQVQVVMESASADAQNDLKDMASDIDKMNQEKAALRRQRREERLRRRRSLLSRLRRAKRAARERLRRLRRQRRVDRTRERREEAEARRRRRIERSRRRAGGGVIAIAGLGILIGLLLLLPGEGMRPLLGLGSDSTPAPCPDDSPTLSVNQQFMLTLNRFRSMIGSDPLCNPSTDAGTDQPPAGQTTGGQTTSGNPPVSSTEPIGTDAECGCVGTDYICKNKDGSIASASYNATQCGGSGQCECRDPNKTLVCPDGTYADFNPQCGTSGTGGQTCTCICDVPDPNNPGKCLQAHDSCTFAACQP